jgi:uncharacterized membrane protein
MNRDRRINLGRRTHKAILLVHIMSAGAWIGIDVVMAVLVFTAWFTDDVKNEVICYQALELFAVWPLLTTGVLSLLTGILLGFGTKYGLVRYWWLFVKLALNLILTALVVASLRFGVADWPSTAANSLPERRPSSARATCCTRRSCHRPR